MICWLQPRNDPREMEESMSTFAEREVRGRTAVIVDRESAEAYIAQVTFDPPVNNEE